DFDRVQTAYDILVDHGYTMPTPDTWTREALKPSAYSPAVAKCLKEIDLGTSAASLQALLDMTPVLEKGPALSEVIVCEAEHEAVNNLIHRWAAVKALSDLVAETLTDIKTQFQGVTQQDAVDYKASIDAFAEDYAANGVDAYLNGVDRAVDIPEAARVRPTYESKLRKLLEENQRIRLAQRLLGLPEERFPALIAAERSMGRATAVLDVYHAIEQRFSSWKEILFVELNPTDLETGCDQLGLLLKKLPKDLHEYAGFAAVKKVLADFRESIPLFQDLTSEGLRPRHWSEIAAITGGELEHQEGLTLGALMELRLFRFVEKISEITGAASKELNIEKQLSTINDGWDAARLPVAKYRDKMYILNSLEEIMQRLEDNSMNLQSMAASRFVRPFAEDVRLWEKRLSLISDVLDAWMGAQRQWLYLEGIFVGSEDIRLQLPEEAKAFDTINRDFVKLMRDTAQNTQVLSACQQPGRLSMLNTLIARMNKCQMSLTNYLYSKRSAFPRFYFISDDELLAVLGHASNPLSVQEHIIKMYDNASKLEFVKDQEVSGIVSGEGELLPLKTRVAVQGPIEAWMSDVEQGMKTTLRVLCKEGVFEYGQSSRVEWLKTHIGMVTLVGSQIWWTWQ
ncbi:dynein heavy chain, partial [Kipferlia bialata]